MNVFKDAAFHKRGRGVVKTQKELFNFRVVQIKTTAKYHLTSIQLTKMQRVTIPTWREYTGTTTLEANLALSCKLKNIHIF